MYPFSKYEQQTGLFRDIPLRISTGSIDDARFYPFALYFNADDSFSSYINENVRLSIIYYFGGFGFGDQYSSYFDDNASTFSSFYGAYAINNKDFIYSSNEINLESLAKIPEFDQLYLVMPTIGLPANEVVFSHELIDMEKDIEYISHKNWTRIDSMITTNSAIHKAKTHHRGYIQYGVPKGLHYDGEDYPVVDQYGRVYVKYFEEYKSTIVLYIIAKNKTIVDEIDHSILSNAVIRRER
jgi:hypothetical protein